MTTAAERTVMALEAVEVALEAVEVAEVAEVAEPELSGLAPDALRAFKEVLADTGGESLRDALLIAAEDPTNPLHRYFEWDDTAAAHAWRLRQAETLIRRVKVRLLPPKKTEPVRVRAFVASRDLGTEDAVGSYVRVTEVAHDAALRAAMLETITRELEGLYEKYSNHAGLFEEALQQVLTRITTTT